jgi:phosphate butyryltransferase
MDVLRGGIMPITRLAEILEAVANRPKRCLVAAAANDLHTLEAVNQAVERSLVDGILVGDQALIHRNIAELKLNPSRFTIVHEPEDSQAAAKAVKLVRQAPGRFLMKGSLTTDLFLRAILDKDASLVEPGVFISQVTVLESPNYPKLLIISDPAVIPAPDLAQKIAITGYVIETARILGIETPKVAILGMTEQVNPKFQSLMDAAALSKMADRGLFKNAFVDGPMALDVAIDPESARMKGVAGNVAGDADGLVFPNIEAGNVFYKVCTKLAGCEMAGILVGTKVPCVVASRSDSSLTKLYSIALAALSVN